MICCLCEQQNISGRVDILAAGQNISGRVAEYAADGSKMLYEVEGLLKGTVGLGVLDCAARSQGCARWMRSRSAKNNDEAHSAAVTLKRLPSALHCRMWSPIVGVVRNGVLCNRRALLDGSTRDGVGGAALCPRKVVTRGCRCACCETRDDCAEMTEPR